VTQTADERAEAQADRNEADADEAIGELEAVIGEEPDIGPLTDGPLTTDAQRNVTADATTTTGAPADPKSDTRQRILDVALDLFTEQGYDGTSLREIAERLGVTKAALYYHFESKEDILMALHMRIHAFGREALLLIGEGPVTLELWGRLLDQIVGEMLAQRKLFLMHERNQAVMEKLHREDHEAEHEDIQNQFRRVLGDERVPVRDRVRMAASFGVVFSSIFMADESFDTLPKGELEAMLREIIHGVLEG
jgi:AcrR family transcriptional regulator